MTPPDDPVMAEILDALEMPRAGVDRWLAELEGFCHRHGRGRPYRSLLDLLADCRAALGRRAD